MQREISRRDFLKLAGLGMASLAFRPFRQINEVLDSENLARVAIRSVSIYAEPNDKSKILYQRYRDDLLNIYYEEVSEDGPGWNPVWYRVWRGYVHSGYLQRVRTQLNPLLEKIPEKGQLAEITVPISQTMRHTTYTGWTPVYRLYNESTHWILGLDDGPDGEPWYRVRDELLDIDYHVKAAHLRPIPAEELTPISPDVPPHKKRIEVSISRQMLTAYENDKIVLQTRISSGVPQRIPVPGQVPTDTPTGSYTIQSKMPSKHMGDGNLTSDLNAYELPGVPWTCFFAPHGVATHGTYWHQNFGIPQSHGCVNMRTEEAKWIFRWSTPVSAVTDWEKLGMGTQVTVV